MAFTGIARGRGGRTARIPAPPVPARHTPDTFQLPCLHSARLAANDTLTSLTGFRSRADMLFGDCEGKRQVNSNIGIVSTVLNGTRSFGLARLPSSPIKKSKEITVPTYLANFPRSGTKETKKHSPYLRGAGYMLGFPVAFWGRRTRQFSGAHICKSVIPACHPDSRMRADAR
jgi:hypothetical protein